MSWDQTLDLSNYGLDYSSTTMVVEEEEKIEEPADPRSLLTQEQVQEFKDIFISYDTQGNGRIPTKSLAVVVRSLGFNPTKAQIKEYMSKADPQGTGMMDFQGFLLPLAENIENVPETLEEILLAFKALDEQDLGYINTNQLQEHLIMLGEGLEDFEIDLLIKMADPKGEGKIMYEDFIDRMIGPPKKKSGKGGDKKKKRGA